MLRSLIHFLIYSNIWVSLASGSLGALFFVINKLEINYFWLLFIASNTLIAYNLQRLFKEKWPENSQHFKWIKKNKNSVYLLMFLASIYSLYFSVQLSKMSLLLILTIGLLSFFYSGSWNKKGSNLRRLPYLKIYIISLSWAGMIVLLPWMETNFISVSQNLILAFAIFTLIVGMTIPFDIRDLQFDSSQQKTIPQLIGLKPSKVLSIVLVVVSAVLLLYLNKELNYLFAGAVLSTAVIVFQANKKKSEFYFSGLLEGMITVMGMSFIFY